MDRRKDRSVHGIQCGVANLLKASSLASQRTWLFMSDFGLAAFRKPLAPLNRRKMGGRTVKG